MLAMGMRHAPQETGSVFVRKLYLSGKDGGTFVLQPRPAAGDYRSLVDGNRWGSLAEGVSLS